MSEDRRETLSDGVTLLTLDIDQSHRAPPLLTLPLLCSELALKPFRNIVDSED